MVSVRIDFGKRDFVWIGLLVVLLGVGFVFAYTVDGSGNPAVMGHSADEIEPLAKVYTLSPATLAVYHLSVDCGAVSYLVFNTACYRYCTNLCSTSQPGVCRAFLDNGLDYVGGFLVEIDCARDIAMCVCVN